MTGVKVRVQRSGQWVEVNVNDLGKDEWPALLRNAERFGQSGWDLVQALVRWIKDRRSSPG